MTAADRLYVDLLAAGVVLVADGERLRVRAPRVGITAEQRAALAAHRDGVRSIVSALYRTAEECAAAVEWSPCRRMGECRRPNGALPCGVPPTSCVCGELLPAGRRYLCRDCGATGDDASTVLPG